MTLCRRSSPRTTRPSIPIGSRTLRPPSRPIGSLRRPTARRAGDTVLRVLQDDRARPTSSTASANRGSKPWHHVVRLCVGEGPDALLKGVLADHPGIPHRQPSSPAPGSTARRPARPHLHLRLRGCPRTESPTDSHPTGDTSQRGARLCYQYFPALDLGRFAEAAGHFSDDVSLSDTRLTSTRASTIPTASSSEAARGAATPLSTNGATPGFDRNGADLHPTRSPLPLRRCGARAPRRRHRQLHLKPVRRAPTARSAATSASTASRRSHERPGADPRRDRQVRPRRRNRDLDGIVDCFSPGGRIDFEGGRTSGEGHAGIRQASSTPSPHPRTPRQPRRPT